MSGQIIGAGGGGKGGGGGGSTPNIARDSLRSQAYASVLDLICEGEIEGLVNGAQSIYLDGTPLQNPDGSYNFRGVTWSTKTGTQSQSYIPGFPAVENVTSVGVAVTAASSVTRQFTNQNLTGVRVTLGFPALSYQNVQNGDVSGTSVSIAIDVQTAGGGFVRQPLSMQSSPASIVDNVASGVGYQMTASFFIAGLFNDQEFQSPDTTIQYRIDGGAWVTLSTAALPYGPVSFSTPRFSSQHAIDMRIVVSSAIGYALINWAEVANYVGYDVISGKTSSRYQRSYHIPLTGDGPWDVRVVRLTEDSTTDNLQNKSYWDLATEIIDGKLRYPNSALVGINVDASQFSSIPTRGYDMRLLRVRVPTNYNPITRAYTGSWDGTFKTAWTDNPAWCFYDLITTDRYGLGAFIDTAQVDKWALYSIGRYCDEMVADGFGSYEPRFTCNMYLQTRQEAYKVLADMASIFRGMAFWSSGSITVVADSPATPAYLYTAANVIDGMFSYSGSSAKARHTVALVTWNDPDDLYKQKVEYVEDLDGINRYGVVTTEVAALGCTSRGQANRAGRWLLYSERLETETVSFKTSIEGMICRPGQVIKIADPARAGVRHGGRIVSTGTTSITLDAPVDLTEASGYTLATLKADGTVQETSVVSSGPGITTVTLSPAFSEAPALNSVWILTSTAVEPQTFRVISVVENERHEFEIVALAHDPAKFDAIEKGLKLEARSISVISTVPSAPTNLQASDALYTTAQGIGTKILVSWSPVDRAPSYVVTARQLNGNPFPEMIVNTTSAEIPNVQDGGSYTIDVKAINVVGQRGPASSISYTVLGKVAPPSDVTDFFVNRNADVLNFVWRHVTDVDLDHYEIRLGSLWSTATQIGVTAANSFAFTTQRGGTFLLKAIDTTRHESENAAEVIVSDKTNINVVVDSDVGAASFPGTYSDTLNVMGGVTLNDGTTPWSSYTDAWATYVQPWALLGATTTGTYTTSSIDIGFVATSVVSIDAVISLLTSSATPWATLTDPWSAYAPPDWTWQGRVAPIGATYDISTSADNITWSAWRPFVQGAYQFRYLRVRVNLTTTDTNYLPYLTGLVVHVDVPDRVLHFKNVAVGVGGATISFSPAFVGVNTVQATLQSALSGDRYVVSGKSTTGVTVNIYDSAGAAKAGTVDVDVFGYGTQG